MIINKFQKDEILLNYLDIYYNICDAEVMAVLNLFNPDKKIIGKNLDKEEIFSPLDVYYFEIVDRKCFAYLHSNQFAVDLNLQNIIDHYSKDGFVRISKSMVVNIYKITGIKADINMRVNAVLDNGEKIIVNRSYRREFYRSIRSLLEKENVYENG